ncbi:MAG: arsenate reductase ArsC [Candidatus Neomarinimicrobiota bacterium]
MDTKKNKILFLCTGNSCRSQIAEALAQREFDENYYFHSAGVEAHGMNPYTVKTLAELDIDVSEKKSKIINDNELNNFDLIITLCGDARDKCPILESKVKHIHWDLKDPANYKGTEKETLSVYSNTRDLILENIIELKKQLMKGDN